MSRRLRPLPPVAAGGKWVGGQQPRALQLAHSTSQRRRPGCTTWASARSCHGGLWGRGCGKGVFRQAPLPPPAASGVGTAVTLQRRHQLGFAPPRTSVGAETAPDVHA